MQKPLTILLMAIIFFSACHTKEKKREENNTYKTLVIQKSDVSFKSEYTAELKGRQIVEIRPQISGLITQIRINEGDKVKRGQTLFIIDQRPYQAALKEANANVKSAEAKLATAKLNMESKEGLEQDGVISDFQVKTTRNELLTAEAALAQAQAQQTNARNNLSYTVVTSPVNGVAGMINYRVGALVSSNITEPLVTVSDDNTIDAYFAMTENQSIDVIQQYGSMESFIKQAPAVELKMSNGKMFPDKGKINAISGIIDSNTGAVTLKASFQNSNHLLRNGGSGSIVMPTELKDCIVIPQTATYELQNRVFVYRVISGHTSATPIEVFHLNNGTEYVVQNGLQTGDTIIAEGAGLLKDGMEIKAQKP